MNAIEEMEKILDYLNTIEPSLHDYSYKAYYNHDNNTESTTAAPKNKLLNISFEELSDCCDALKYDAKRKNRESIQAIGNSVNGLAIVSVHEQTSGILSFSVQISSNSFTTFDVSLVGIDECLMSPHRPEFEGLLFELIKTSKSIEGYW